MLNDKQLSIRLPSDLVDRATALLSAVQTDQLYRLVPRKEVAFVLRLAIEQGLEKLEQQYRKGT